MIDFYFFGKDCGIDRELANREQLNLKLAELNISPIATLFLNQVHGNQVVVIDSPQKIYGEQCLPKADGLVSNQKNLALAIITADCGPIVFYDEENLIIGICHAGWRGAKSGILENTVFEMKKLGAVNICAAIGPMIQQYSYQVSRDFYDDFIQEKSSNTKFFKTSKEQDKWQFSLSSYIYEKIEKLGIDEIENLEIDTYTNEGKYHSYRRNSHRPSDDYGRNISLIINR